MDLVDRAQLSVECATEFRDRTTVGPRHLRDLLDRRDHALRIQRMAVGAMEDLLGAGRRLGDGGADLGQRAGDRVDVLASLADHLARLSHLVRDHRRVGLDFVHELADLVGASPCTLGELADLVGDDGEAATGLARARGLDRRVQGQEVRAVCDGGDDLGDLVDMAGLGFEFEDLVARALGALEDRLHLLDGESRDLDAGAGLLIGLGGEAEGLARASRVQIDLARDLVHAQARLVEELLLLGDAPGDLPDGLRDLFARGLEAIERGLESGRRRRDRARGVLHFRHELA